MKQQEKNIYEFGPYRIDKVERLLRREKQVIPLPPKAIETLLVLVENAGRVVEEGSLAQNISLLRKVLRGGPKPPYIETIPKRGYRFAALVNQVHEQAES